MRKTRIAFIAFFAFLIFRYSDVCLAQLVAPSLATPVVIDLVKHTAGDIPFDKPFYLTGSFPDNTVHKIEFLLKEGRNSGTFTSIGSYTSPNTSDGKSTCFKKDVAFCLTFISEDMKKINENCDYLLPSHEYTLKLIVTDVAGAEISDYTFTYGFYPKTKIGDYTKLDFGLGYVPAAKALIGYSNVHFYFTAINDETDLRQIRRFRRNFFLRTSIFMGVSPATLASDTKQPIKNEFGLGNFTFGVGLRSPFYWSFMNKKTAKKSNKVGQQILQPMRLVFAGILFKQVDQNSLIPKDRHKVAPFVGISYDLNIASILGPIGKLVTQ